MCSKRGLTLIELMVALFILALIVGATFAIYVSNLKIYKSEAKTAETQMSKVLALELLRRDIVHAGAGLPWDLWGITYNEATESAASPYNDATGDPPRAFVLGNNVTIENDPHSRTADYLVIKGALAANNESTRKWGELTHDGAWTLEEMGEGGSFNANDWVILVSAVERRLHHDTLGNWSFQGPANSIEGTSGLDTNTIYLAYGVRRINNAGDTVRMPFNRVDYFLEYTSNLPDKCSPNSYILYRATINHNTSSGTVDGRRSKEPILDCVRDFQVAFGIDPNEDGQIDRWSDQLTISATSLVDINSNGSLDAEDIRRQVREVRVFILYQEGQRSDEVISTSTITLGDGQTGTLSTFTPAGEDQHYRWKVLKVTVRPLNLGT